MNCRKFDMIIMLGKMSLESRAKNELKINTANFSAYDRPPAFLNNSRIHPFFSPNHAFKAICTSYG